MAENSIILAMQAAKSLTDIVKAFAGVHDTAKYNEKVLELQGALFVARDEQTAAHEAIRELKEKIVQFEKWDAEKARYELKAVARGTLVYAIKETMRGSEPVHWICAACYQQAKKSILQRKRGSGGLGIEPCSFCPACEMIVDAVL